MTNEATAITICGVTKSQRVKTNLNHAPIITNTQSKINFSCTWNIELKKLEKSSVEPRSEIQIIEIEESKLRRSIRRNKDTPIPAIYKIL
jgi:hypothetical protein